MIKIRNLNKSFGSHVIFKNLNIEIKEKEKVAIIGASGCGKSTLLNIMCGIEEFNEGLVEVCSVTNPKIGKIGNDFYSSKISILMQDYGLIASDSIFDNIKIGCPKVKTNEVIEALKKVNLSSAPETKVHTLSGGEMQRVALARVLIKPSEVILCDEPTGNLDDATANEIEELILNIDKTMVIVTHNIDFAMKCDRVIEL